MTITATTTLTTQAQAFAADYGVACIDFVWTSTDGFDTYTVFAAAPEEGTLTTKVPNFDYSNGTDDTRIRELLMTVVDDTEWNTTNITQIGGTLSISATEAPLFEGDITSVSNTSIQY